MKVDDEEGRREQDKYKKRRILLTLADGLYAKARPVHQPRIVQLNSTSKASSSVENVYKE